MGYKVFIALVWLTLPLSVLLMLQRDRERFELEGELQRERTEAWEQHLTESVSLASRHAEDVDYFDDAYDRRRWEQDWARAESIRQSEELSLGNMSFSHYPRAQELLEEASSSGRDQRRSIAEAARLKESYLASSEGLFRLQQDIDMLEQQVAWWGFQQQIGIYLNLQEHLAKLESAYRQRRQARNELNRNVSAALHEAELSARNALSALSRLPDARLEDEGRTYREHLALRFASFDLRAELHSLLITPAGADQGSARQTH